MIAKKTEDLDISSLKALVPRGLIDPALDLLGSAITVDGLCPICISWNQNRITKLEAIDIHSEPSLKLILPRFVETHAHIDKAFTWKNYPNLLGTYSGALNANLKEHQMRSPEQLIWRAEKSMKIALKNGFRAIRTHVDIFGTLAEETWEILIDLQKQWQRFLQIQLVAMAPLEYWSTQKGKSFARRIAFNGGLIGGVLVPPFNSKDTRKFLKEMLSLANQLGAEVDLHIDESSSLPAAGVKELIAILDQMDFRVPLTCSHLSSMGLLPKRSIRHLADRLAHHEVNVVALPLTNAWLLGRQPGVTPTKRPLAPLAQLQKAGVNVSIGGDNVQDPWFPGGSFDPLSLMASSMTIAQLEPWNRLGLAPFTTSASRIMNLEWDCTFSIGSPAEFIYLEASSWIEALFALPRRKVLIGGKFLDEDNFHTDKNI